ncbi:MAG: hypothetical protein A4E28_01996 [Methanocella sp. PtaU1.Bin125]|nr:MAG: hypothetical protein A4E28_01996 [Methanocella sp. PtaU1.Bin125]
MATEDIKFIITFTVCFVVVGCIVIGAGYALVSWTDLFKPGDGAPMVTPVPSNVPEGPTPTPAPTAPIIIPVTATPKPTPKPTSYYVNVNYIGDASSRTYEVSYTLGKNPAGQLSGPINLDLALFSVWEAGIIYQNYTYDQAIASGAGWSGANGDHWLESGETFVFKVNGYSLNIPPDTQSQVTLVVEGEVIRTTTLPYLINPVITGPPVDPEATVNPYGY